MTFEEFAGTPRIGEVSGLRVRPPRMLHPRHRFRGTLEIVRGEDRGDVLDADDHVAGFVVSDKYGDSRLWVREDYRGEGISEELVYEVLARTGRTVRSSLRTAHSHRIYRRVYDRIMRELMQMEAA